NKRQTERLTMPAPNNILENVTLTARYPRSLEEIDNAIANMELLKAFSNYSKPTTYGPKEIQLRKQLEYQLKLATDLQAKKEEFRTCLATIDDVLKNDKKMKIIMVERVTGDSAPYKDLDSTLGVVRQYEESILAKVLHRVQTEALDSLHVA